MKKNVRNDDLKALCLGAQKPDGSYQVYPVTSKHCIAAYLTPKIQVVLHDSKVCKHYLIIFISFVMMLLS